MRNGQTQARVIMSESGSSKLCIPPQLVQGEKSFILFKDIFQNVNIFRRPGGISQAAPDPSWPGRGGLLPRLLHQEAHLKIMLQVSRKEESREQNNKKKIE